METQKIERERESRKGVKERGDNAREGRHVQ